MKTHIKTLLRIAPLTVVVMAATQAADPAPTTAPAFGDREASCLLRITSDPAILPLQEEVVRYLLASSGVAQDAVKEVLGEPGGADVTFELLGGGVGPAKRPGTGPRGPVGGMGPAMGGTGGAGGGAAARAGGMMGGGFGGEGGPMLVGPGAAAGMAGTPGPYGAPSVYTVTSPDGQCQTLIGRLIVSSPDRGQARETMAAVIKRLQATLKTVGEQEKQRLVEELKRAAMLAEETLRQLEVLQKKRQEMVASTPFNDLARDSILEMSRKLEAERQDISVKIAALQARREALTKSIAEVAHDAERTEAEQIAKARDRAEQLRRNLEDFKQKAAAKGETDADSAKARVAETEAAIYQLEQAIASRMASEKPRERVAAMNDQMGALVIDLAEAEARVKTLEEQCKSMRGFLDRADNFELHVGLRLPLVRAAYESAWLRQEELSRRMESISTPSLTTIGE